MLRLATAVAALCLASPAVARADIIVQRETGLSGAEQAELRSDAGVKLVETLPIARTEVVRAAPGDQADALAALNAEDGVVYAEPDAPVHALTNDFFWTSLWGLSNTGSGGGVAGADISAVAAWTLSQGAGVTVGVVDTGVNFSHVDLAGQLTGNPNEIAGNGIDDDHNGYVDDSRGWDWVDDDNLPEDGFGHGTHVTGTIAALAGNNTGVAGVAPQAKVMPLRALDSSGGGSMSDVAAAFAYAGRLGLRVVNASLGGGDSLTLRNAIAAYPNTLYVVAAGNAAADNDSTATTNKYPCAYPLANIVCVGATDDADQPASFSNHGRTSVDLYAPGVDIVSTYKSSPSSYVLMSGTSMATPHVAGAAALAFAANPALTAAQVKSALLASADVKPQLTGLSVTGGRLNAYAAVAAIEGVTPDPAPTATPPAPPAPAATPTPAPVSAPVVVTPPVATPAPVRTVTPAPVLRHLRVGGSLKGRHGRLRVTFSLTRGASVRFTVSRRGSHKPAAIWSASAHSGANAFSLTRRLPTRKTLAAGDYTLAVGLAAKATSARFRVR